MVKNRLVKGPHTPKQALVRSIIQLDILGAALFSRIYFQKEFVLFCTKNHHTKNHHDRYLNKNILFFTQKTILAIHKPTETKNWPGRPSTP